MTTRGSTSGKAPTPTEHEEQVALIGWWNMYAKARHMPSLLLMAIPNGGRRTTVTGARLHAEGVRAGIPDLVLALARGEWHGLWLEMKRRKGGFLSDPQREALLALKLEGYYTAVCYGWDEAREAILDYLEDDHVDA